jgi:hypothetical protein
LGKLNSTTKTLLKCDNKKFREILNILFDLNVDEELYLREN